MGLKEWFTGYWGERSRIAQAVAAECAKCPVELPVQQKHLGPLFDIEPVNKAFAPICPPAFKLKLVVEKLRGRSTYDSPYNQKPEAEYYRIMHKAAATGDDSVYGTASTQIDGNYVMTIDCDGTDEMLAVCHVLKTYYGLDYAVVVSSPNHYWVIVDKWASVGNILEIMELLPGVDPRYVECVRGRYELVLRSMPRDCMPIFPDSVDFKDEHVARWYKEFKDTWNSPEMKHILRLKQLVKAIKNKSVADLAASPNFTI